MSVGARLDYKYDDARITTSVSLHKLVTMCYNAQSTLNCVSPANELEMLV
jgi:hypothetical protein